MSAGTPVVWSKKTLCATEPNAKVTSVPALTVSVAGENVSEGVAATVLAAGGGAVESPPLSEPQPVAASRTPVSRARVSCVVRVNMACSAG